MEEQLLAQPEEVDGKLIKFNTFVVGNWNFKWLTLIMIILTPALTEIDFFNDTLIKIQILIPTLSELKIFNDLTK